MLYKKELAQIAVCKMPDIEIAREFVAAAQVVDLKRSGKILVVDFFRKKAKSLFCRFVCDGKNYLTLVGDTWTEQNPRAHIGYGNVANLPEDAKPAADFLNASRHNRDYLLDMVDGFVSEKMWGRRQKAQDQKEALRKKHFAMFPDYPDNLWPYCDTKIFDAYIFIDKLDKKGVRRGRCSYCGKTFEVPRDARSGREATCPACGKAAAYRAVWTKGSVVDKAKICIAAKVDGNILIRWTDVERSYAYPDFRAHYYADDYAYSLKLNTEKGVTTYFYKWCSGGSGYYPDWHRGRIGDLCWDSTYVYTDNLEEVFGKNYCNVNLQEGLAKTKGKIAFDLLLTRLRTIPAAEYLFKLGMTHLAEESNGISGASAPKQPSFRGVLGIDARFMELYTATNPTLYEHLLIKRYGQWVAPEHLEMYRALKIPGYEGSRAEALLKTMSFSRFVHYFAKQKRLNPKRSITNILTCYKDYIDMSQGLGVDLSHKGIRFPKNCVEAHDKILPRFNEKKHEIEDAAFVAAVTPIYAGLRLTAFEKDGFCIVLPQLRSDLITEGQSLNHCVGGDGYYRNHIAGTRMIFFVREAKNRAKPFFTMEVDMQNFRICQLYGFGDCSAPKEVRKFAEAFVRKLAPSRTDRAAS